MHEDPPDLEEARKELDEARARFDGADSEERFARSKRTTALNELNRAQKKFDAAVAAIRENAPRDSDWKQAERRRDEVEC